MKSIKQFVFYGIDDERNNPKDFSAWEYNLLKNHGMISHLGIQGSPQLLFCLNGAADKDAISIGKTGIYEIDLNGIGYISSLRFVKESLETCYPNDMTDKRRLIVDIVCEEV